MHCALVNQDNKYLFGDYLLEKELSPIHQYISNIILEHHSEGGAEL